MANTIGNIGIPAARLARVVGNVPPVAGKGDGMEFQQLLKSALQETAGLQNQAQHSIAVKLAGGDLTNAEVFTDVRKADLALRMLLQIRNKLLESFNEIKRMQF